MVVTDVPLDRFSAAVAGLIAGLLMESPAYLQRWVGYLGHAGLSVVIALAYVVLFRTVAAVDHLMAWGVLGGLVHFAIGGLVLSAVFPVVDPACAVAGQHRVGFAYACYGRRDVLTFFGGHLCFGVLLGLLYPGLHPALDGWAAL